MSEELKSTQIYYGENVLMMRVEDCLIFGNKDALRRLAEKLEKRTAKVIEHDASITVTDGYKYHRSEYLCSACKKKVIGGDEYCSHCGCRLDWDEDIPMEYFENGGI